MGSVRDRGGGDRLGDLAHGPGMVSALPLDELVIKGRVAVIFLLDIAERLKGYPKEAELVADCRKLARILSTAIEAIAAVIKEEHEEP
jgi:hypothetical protein